MANDNVEMQNLDRLLVAMDIVSYFMKKEKPHLTAIFQDTSIGNAAEGYRRNAHLAFSEHFKTVLDFIDETHTHLVRRDFEVFFNNRSTRKESLTDYARSWKSTHCDVENSIKEFSIYCGRIAAMASYFYDIGVMDAPDFAVELIVSSFPNDPNLNWTYRDFANEMNVNTRERSETYIQNYTRREPLSIISSETEESSNESIRIRESDSSSNDQFQQSGGCFETQTKSFVTPSVEVEEVESLTLEISELSLSDSEHNTAVTEQTEGCNSLAPAALTRSRSISPRKRSFPKDESSRSKSASGEVIKPSSSLGKRRSSGGSVCSNVSESAAVREETAEAVFLPCDPKKSKTEEVDKSE